MVHEMALTPQQSYWDQQSQSLQRVRNNLGEHDARKPPHKHKASNKYQPLSDEHPLLQGNRRSSNSPPVHKSPRDIINGQSGTPPLVRGRHSRTPPSRLPRMQTPPDHRHEGRVRGVHFDVLPNVRNQHNGYDNGHDSWGEEAESDSDGEYGTNYPQFPYPVVMYPMVLPQHQRRKPPKDRGKKKRVRMRNTPVMLNSRENTLHEPQMLHDMYSTYSYDDDDRPRYMYDTYDGGGAHNMNSPHFSYIAPSQNYNDYDPFNPRLNPVLARYQVPVERGYNSPPHHPVRHMRYQRRESPRSYSPDRSYGVNALELCVTEVIDEILSQGASQVVRETMGEMVDTHLEKAAVYDIAVDLVNEYMEQVTEDIATDAFEEVFYDSFLEEFVIAPVVAEQSREIIKDVCDNYNNKKRRADLRLVKKDTGDKLIDSLCLDYLFSLAARQGQIWTEGEHANKLYDSLILNLLLEQMHDVKNMRQININEKPLRRHHEKMVTDVAVDVLLEELCNSLDEDMADLDEYEMGLENTAAKQKYSDLENILTGL